MSFLDPVMAGDGCGWSSGLVVAKTLAIRDAWPRHRRTCLAPRDGRGRRRRRLTQHSLPGCLLSITWVGLSPTDRASFAWRLRRAGPAADSCVAKTNLPCAVTRDSSEAPKAYQQLRIVAVLSSNQPSISTLPDRMNCRKPFPRRRNVC